MNNLKNTILIFSLSLLTIIGITTSSAQAMNDYQPHIDQFDFLNADTGWVLLGNQLFWTSNSGQTWNEIGPFIPAEATVQDVEFINSNTGWVLWMMLNTDGSSSITIAHTANHGTDWEITTPSLFEAGEILAYSGNAAMGWFDTQNGWIAVKQFSGSNFSLGTLFTTSDSGNTWLRSKLPIADQITFSDPYSGWAIGGPTGNQIFKTRDGGTTWQSVNLVSPSNSNVTVYNPLTIDGQSILVLTNLEKESMALHVFNEISNDWLHSDQITVDAQPGIIGLSIIDTQNFIMVIPGTNMIVRMKDGLLEKLKNQDGLSSSITNLDMISLITGWAKSVESSCTTTSSPGNTSDSVSCTSVTHLLKTINGGLSWQEISLPNIQLNTTNQTSRETNLSASLNTIANLGNTESFSGQGFDKCEIPTLSQLQTWWDNGPYKVVNLYIGGSSRAC